MCPQAANPLLETAAPAVAPPHTRTCSLVSGMSTFAHSATRPSRLAP